MIFKALIDSEIIYEESTTVIDEEDKYRRLKEDIKMMKCQKSDAEKGKLIEEGKRIEINMFSCKIMKIRRAKKSHFFVTRIKVTVRTRKT